MTPKTQSVCKHCGQKLVRRPADRHNWYDPQGGVWCYATKYKSRHEPVAEPAGEPEIPRCAVCQTPMITVGSSWTTVCGHSIEAKGFGAARPSEPSAPACDWPFEACCTQKEACIQANRCLKNLPSALDGILGGVGNAAPQTEHSEEKSK